MNDCRLEPPCLTTPFHHYRATVVMPILARNGEQGPLAKCRNTNTKRNQGSTVMKRRSLSVKGLIITCSVALITSCATYTLSASELHKQIATAVPVEGTYFYTPGGLFLFNHSMNNGIRTLNALTSDGKEISINVTQRTSIRIHTKDGDYSTFYFDTMFMKNDSIIGDRTHFFPSAIKPIAFSDVVKIELQR